MTDGRATEHPRLIQLGERQTLAGYLRELWSRREYAIEVPRRELQAQHMNTLLGNAWHLLNPLLLIGVYYLVFGVIIGTDRGVDNFLAFLSVGVFTFRFTQTSVQTCAGSIVTNDGLIRSIYFPRALLPIATVVQSVLTLVPAAFLMIVIALATGQRPLLGWLLVPAIFALQTVFNLGAGFIAARVTDSFRDFQNILPFIFRVLFYLSGVLYAVDRYVDDPALLRLFDLNPAYAFITLARNAVLGEPASGTVLASAVGWSVVLLVAGFAYFRAAESRYGRG